MGKKPGRSIPEQPAFLVTFTTYQFYLATHYFLKRPDVCLSFPVHIFLLIQLNPCAPNRESFYY